MGVVEVVDFLILALYGLYLLSDFDYSSAFDVAAVLQIDVLTIHDSVYLDSTHFYRS